jgi:hypothetical protein
VEEAAKLSALESDFATRAHFQPSTCLQGMCAQLDTEVSCTNFFCDKVDCTGDAHSGVTGQRSEGLCICI